MTRIAATATALTMIAFATACSQAPEQAGNHDADIKVITEDLMRWKSDFKAKDLDKMLTHYADESVVVVPGVPAARNAEARRGVLKGMIADPALELTSQDCPRVEVSKSGDIGYALCTYVMTVTDPGTGKTMSDRGTLTEVYKKQADGSWRAIADTATSEVPPPAPPVPAKGGK